MRTLLSILLLVGLATSSGIRLDAVTSSQVNGDSYYVSLTGNDDWPGTINQPWRTLQHAGEMLQAGDTLYIRGGDYVLGYQGVDFHYSGTASQPITVTNYPGEQVIIQGVENTDPGTHTHHERLYHYGFICFQAQGQFPIQADHIRIIGQDLPAPQPIPASDTNPTLGRTSRKGIVMAHFDVAIRGEGCNYWEISGLEIFNCGMCGDGYEGTCSTAQAHEGYCIFNTRGYHDGNDGQQDPQTTNFWHVHDNVIYNAAEVPLQLNGDFNLIEHNDIFHGEVYGDNGSQGPPIILLGHHNVVRHNFLHDSGQTFGGFGGPDYTWGLLVENDMADLNLIEANVVFNAQEGITVWGGDNNLIRNNLIFTEDWYDAPNQYSFGLLTAQKGCDSTPAQHPYCPDGDRYNNCQYINDGVDDCFPEDNVFYHNTVYGFQYGLACGCEYGCSNSCDATHYANNAVGGVFYSESNFGNAVFENNLGIAGVVNVPDRDFRLLDVSPLIDAGVNLGTCEVPDLASSTHASPVTTTEPCAGRYHVGLTRECIEAIRDRPEDHRIAVDDLSTCFVSEPRKWGDAVDVGAYEMVSASPTLALNGTPADRAIHLTWSVNVTLPVTSTWQIDYVPQTGSTVYPPITGIVSPTRAYTLTGLTNYVWYTITLNAMLDAGPILTDTVRVMPTDRFVYLPLVMR